MPQPILRSHGDPRPYGFHTLTYDNLRASVPFDEDQKRIVGGKHFNESLERLIQHPLLVGKPELVHSIFRLGTTCEAGSDKAPLRVVTGLGAQFDDYACLIPFDNQVEHSSWLRVACLFGFSTVKGLRPKWRNDLWIVRQLLREDKNNISVGLREAISAYEADFMTGHETTQDERVKRIAHLRPDKQMHLMLTALGAIKALSSPEIK